jgi:hypothetical protein
MLFRFCATGWRDPRLRRSRGSRIPRGAPGAAGLDQVPEAGAGPVLRLDVLMPAGPLRDPGKGDLQPGDQLRGFRALGIGDRLSSVPAGAGRVQPAVYVLVCPSQGQGEAAGGAAVRHRLAVVPEEGHAEPAGRVPGRRGEEVVNSVVVGGPQPGTSASLLVGQPIHISNGIRMVTWAASRAPPSPPGRPGPAGPRGPWGRLRWGPGTEPGSSRARRVRSRRDSKQARPTRLRRPNSGHQ